VNQLEECRPDDRWFVDRPAGNPKIMEQQGKPKDATQTTDEQREMQDQLDHRDDDPEAPARHQDRHQVADET
jgi:hypothetical protein